MIPFLLAAVMGVTPLDCTKYERSPVIKLDCELFNTKHQLYDRIGEVDGVLSSRLDKLEKTVYGNGPDFIIVGGDSIKVSDIITDYVFVRGLVERLDSLENLPKYRLDSTWIDLGGYCPDACNHERCTTAYCPPRWRVDTLWLDRRQ